MVMCAPPCVGREDVGWSGSHEPYKTGGMCKRVGGKDKPDQVQRAELVNNSV